MVNKLRFTFWGDDFPMSDLKYVQLNFHVKCLRGIFHILVDR